MTFPILGANSAVGGYAIDNSLRFNDNDSAYLSRTPASAGNRKTWTWSGWVKRCETGDTNLIFDCQTASDYTFFGFTSADQFQFRHNTSFNVYTPAVFRDVSAWYHIIVVFDSTQATATNRRKIYINGVLQSLTIDNEVDLNADGFINSTNPHFLGSNYVGAGVLDGYMAEVHFIDGQALSHTDFGEFDEDSGIWKPIRYSGSYGTNGFYLDFENSGSLGADSSPNGNNFTPTNLASTDQTTDTPTNNWCTANPLDQSGCTFSEGNLKLVTPTAGGITRATFGMSTGKWYWEVRATTNGNVSSLGILKTDNPVNQYLFQADDGYTYEANTGNKYNNSSGTSYGATYTTGDIIGISYDADAGDLEFFKNGVSQGTAYTGLTGTFAPAFSDGSGDTAVTYDINFAQNGSFNGTETAQGNSDGNGKGDFYYAPPSGYLALCTQNLATELSPTIDDGSQYFNTVLYSGNGSTQSITGVGFQPDWVWVKNRTSARNNVLVDSSRGVQLQLISDFTSAESNNPDGLTAFGSDGFSVGSASAWNESSNNMVGWNWKANAGSTSSNTDGSITSTVQANTTAGFSIVTYTGTGANATIGHGLGVAPKVVITKSRNNSGTSWAFGSDALTNWNYSLELDTTDAEASVPSRFNGTAPTSSVFSIGASAFTGENGYTYVAYCFADIEGYSKFGKYTGNGSTDGTFVYTGFRPAFVLFKSSSIAGENWVIQDSTRDSYNLVYHRLDAERSNAETTNIGASHPNIDILSNGFKLRGSGNVSNGSGATYIYMAFAENPFVSSTGIPVTAR